MNPRLHRVLVSVASLALFTALAIPSVAEQPIDIPSGTQVKVRMVDHLSSEDNQIGDTFAATLEEPITINGRDVYPKGADVNGRIVDIHKSGRLSEPGELDLVLTTISTGHSATSISVQPLVLKGESHAKSNTAKIGGGAALGAIIGAVAGGGKGAAIGAGVGGAAGTGAAAAGGRRPATVDSEAILTFTSGSGSTSAKTYPAPPPNDTNDDRPPAQSSDNAAPPPANANADDAPPPSQPYDNGALFTMRDRRVIRDCVREHVSDFPPGLTERSELPAGSERQLKRGEVLSSDVQHSVKSLPLDCENQLPRLPSDQDRVLYNGRILLVDGSYHILDTFNLDDNQ
jgi:hypothetical protein